MLHVRRVLLGVCDAMIASDPTSTFTFVPRILASASGKVWCKVRGNELLMDSTGTAAVDCFQGQGPGSPPAALSTPGGGGFRI